MGQKDIAEKILEDYEDVFADIVNVLLFGGREIVAPEELETLTALGAYKADGKLREVDRDVFKKWKNGGIRLASIGIENQTSDDSDMPIRVLAYDAAAYRAQLSGKDRYPVITLVLHFDTENRWQASKSLHERLEVDDLWKPYVNDYRINLFEIAYLPRETVDKFKSDFWYVADYFVQVRETGEYVPKPDEVTHIWEVLTLLSILLKDSRFEDAIQTARRDGKELTNMCKFLDEVENRGKEAGRAEGREEGRAEGREVGRAEGRAAEKKDMALRMHGMGMADEQIALCVNEAVETVREWIGEKDTNQCARI